MYDVLCFKYINVCILIYYIFKYILKLQMYTVSQKQATTLLPVTLSNANRFSKFFQWQTYKYICIKVNVKYPTTPLKYCYTSLWNVNVRKLATVWNMYCR